MKNPYLYGYLPLITIILFSLTFGLFAVAESMSLFESIGVYAGMREFLSDLQLRIFLLVIFSLCFFMLFSALKLIGETIHELGMLFFSKDQKGELMHSARGGYVIFFFGACLSIIGIQSFIVLVAIFALTTAVYFVYSIYKVSSAISFGGLVGLICFEILFWSAFIVSITYIVLKLYNGILASLPFI